MQKTLVFLGFAAVSALGLWKPGWVPTRFGDPGKHPNTLRPVIATMMSVFVALALAPVNMWGSAALGAALVTLALWAAVRSRLQPFAPPQPPSLSVVRRAMRYPVGSMLIVACFLGALFALYGWYNERTHPGHGSLLLYATCGFVIGAASGLGAWEKVVGEAASARRLESQKEHGKLRRPAS